jgi:nucleotide-binding universal stress UspA family protein
MIEEDTAAAMRYFEDVKQSALLRDLQVECVAEVGLPASLILDQAEQQHADLIVMCSHGRSGLGRWVLGSVAEHVSRHASVPTLILSEHGKIPLDSPDPEHLLRALTPLDGSPLAETALAPAAALVTALAAAQPAALHLTLVVDPFDAIVRESLPEALVVGTARGYLMRTVARLQAEYPGLTITWSVNVHADVAAGILQVAEVGEDTAGATPFGGCDLIVMATHGRSGFRRWALGSVAERVLHNTKLPVMLARPPMPSAQEQGPDAAEVSESLSSSPVAASK